MSGVVLGFDLLGKMLLTNQIGRFLKVQYLKKEFKYEVYFLGGLTSIEMTYQLTLVWMAGNVQNTSK